MPKQEYDASVPLQLKTWVLKVPIHCDGCEKKVKKTLLKIQGVFLTSIDPQQHKITVTGDVEADTLIRKLLKAGKPAELWAENLEEEKEEGKEGKSKKTRAKKEEHEHSSNLSDEDSGKEGSSKEIAIKKVEQVGGGEGNESKPENNNGSGEPKRKKKKNKKKKKKKKSKINKSNDEIENVVCDQTYVLPPATAIWEPHMEQTHRIEHVYPYPSLAYGLRNSTMSPTVSTSYYSPNPLYYKYGAWEGNVDHFAPPLDRIARVDCYYDYDGYNHDEEESRCFIM